MTPQIKTIILSNGEVLSDQGVKRAPKVGDWIVDRDGAYRTAFYRHIPSPILTPLETQGQKIERRGDWSARTPHTINGAHDLNPFIDAACRVVNRPQIALHFPTEAQPLAAALAPFTQPIKPKDRYYVECGRVYDRQDEAVPIGSFHSGQDAESFAALKNSQDGGE